MRNLKACAHCGSEFEPVRFDQRFHTRECHDQFYVEERRQAVAAYRQMKRWPQMFVVDDDKAEVA